LSGCAASGPQGLAVRAGLHSDANAPHYAFVPVTPKIIKALASARPRLVSEFRDRRPPPNIRFGIGDVLNVTIFEAQAGGLFIPAQAGVRPGNFINLPSQAVDEHGDISIPYAGAIRAKGRTQTQLQNAIVDALKNQAIRPQVIVSLTKQETSMVNVFGDVRNPGRYPALQGGERILDTITRAGGPQTPGPDVWVILDRDGRRAISPFGALVYEPKNDIWTHPNDTIYLYSEPQTFLAFGALGSQRQTPFDAWHISLAEAMAKVGGLDDNRADATSVFLYRGETRQTVEEMGVDTSQYKGPIIPVIYNLNLLDPSGYFLATQFEMRDKDVIYVSNSASVEMVKFRNFLATIYGTATDPMNAAITYYTLKNVSTGTGAATIIPSTPTVVPAPTPPPGG
jgi:polysaccharide biosynthesis/export protein